MSVVTQDISYALRLFRKSPVITLIVVLTLAIGIGANTALFSVVDGILLRPLPFPQSESIARIWLSFPGIGLPKNRNYLSAPELMDLQAGTHMFSAIGTSNPGDYTVTFGDQPETVSGATISSSLLGLLGESPILGRAFRPEEDRPGATPVALLSYQLWENRFNKSPDALGKLIKIDGVEYTIVGVLPPKFYFQNVAQIYIPSALPAELYAPAQRGTHFLAVYARLKPGVTYTQAQEELDALITRWPQQFPSVYRIKGLKSELVPLLEDEVGDVKPILWVLSGAIGLVLLIACVNIANLLLVRLASRERELAIRAALGASRKRVVRQLLTESIFLSILGVPGALVLAYEGIIVLSQLGAGSIPRLGEIQLDWRVLGFAFVLSLVTGVLFGILPAAASGKMSVNDRLKENGARGASSGKLGKRSRVLLVGSEIALAAILLVGAGLLLRSILQLQRVDPGFDPNRVVTMRMSLNSQKYPDLEHIGLFYSNLLAKVQTLPGVESAGLVSALPLSATNNSGMTTMETVSQGSSEPSTETDWIVATPGYFETMHIGLVEGRLFDARDAAQAPKVAIIDQAMAHAYWPHESAVGKRIKLGRIASSHPWMTIIGVVREVHYATLQKIARMQLYWPENQDPARAMTLTVRTPLASRAMADEISNSIHGMDPDLSLYSVRGMSEVVSDSLARQKFSLSLLMVFAGLATMLAAVGIYGVVSYTVTQRTQEIGLRMALGANRVDTIAMIFGETIRIALAGIVIGLVVSLLLARLISSMLFGVPSYDFVTLGAVLALLMIVSCFAILGPALRASAIAPGVALAQN